MKTLWPLYLCAIVTFIPGVAAILAAWLISGPSPALLVVACFLIALVAVLSFVPSSGSRLVYCVTGITLTCTFLFIPYGAFIQAAGVTSIGVGGMFLAAAKAVSNGQKSARDDR